MSYDAGATRAIADYEKGLSLARLDLAHVNATLAIFERVNDTRKRHLRHVSASPGLMRRERAWCCS